MSTSRSWAAAVCASALLLLGAGGGMAADTLSPDIDMAIAAGGSATVAKTLHLDQNPAKADIVIAVDTTSSMHSAIDSAKRDATNIVTDVQAQIPGARFAVVDFQDYNIAPFGKPDDHPYRLDTGLTGDAKAVQTSIGGLTLGDGGDVPEAYNRVFYEAYSDPGLAYDPRAERFLIVLGDSFAHDSTQAEEPIGGTALFPACSDTTRDDPGRDATVGTADDLKTKQTLDGLIAHNTTLSFVSYNRTSQRPCEQQMATYTGGSLVDAGANGTLADQILGLLEQAADHVQTIQLTTDPAHSSWLSFDPPAPYGPFDVPDGGLDVHFNETITVPPGTPAGDQSFDVRAIVDGAVRGTQHVTVHVRLPLTNLTLTADQTSVPAGLKSVPIANIPPSRYAFFGGSTPVGSVPVGSTPVGSTPVGSVPVGSVPVGSTPVGSVPVGSTGLFSLPVGSTPVGSVPVGSVPVGSTPLANLLLSQLPLGGGHTWGEVLACSPLAQLPQNAVTLDQVINDTTTCRDGLRAVQRLNALPLSAVPFVSNLLAGTRLASLLLGTVPIGTYTIPGFSTFTAALSGSGGDTTGITNQTTALGLDMAGHLGSTPVGSVPVGSTPNSVPVGSTPVGSVPVGSVSVQSSRLADVKVRDMAPASAIVNCTTVDCSATSTATLGSAYPGGILPTATLGAAALQAALAAAGITIDDLIIAILTQSSFPFEQLPIQGLQDVPGAGTGQNVTYRLAVGVDCSVASSFKAQTTLPAGFFPVAGSAKFTYSDGGTSIAAPDPAWDADANRATWTISPCDGDTTTRHVTVRFDAYPGLKLGSFTADAKASFGSFVLTAANQAPVKVTENWESNDDPLTAPIVDKDSLIVFHISASGDQDFFRFPLNGLARGTKIAVFMSHIPIGADFDLTLSRPATSFSSTPVGSVPVGSTPIEDRGVVVDNSGQALPSETLQDIPVGSVPVGSTPVGSTPVGSTSTNRGSADEAAGVVLQGEGTAGNYLTIGASGYNGSSSPSPAVIRIKVTPPPPLPANCPARSFAFGPVSSSNQGTLPSSLPATTKTVFLVNKQRLAAMYGISAVNTMISKLTALAARSEVNGSILFVDGDQNARTAYSNWDADPCSVDKANAVVRANNDVVATYGNSLTGLPNLHYVVLIGNDEAIPAGRIPDPVTLSPELDEAADLAFTTDGLTKGNALYNAEALNNILSDGVYGAFSSIQWLGHDLPLPQVSVARLVEDPTAISNLVDTYTLKSGTINPSDAVVTGYDFLSDGATAVKQNIATNVPGTATSLNANSLISPNWTAADITTNFFGKATPPGIASLNAHYSHRLLQPAAGTTLVNAGAVPASDPGGIVFTMGCHSALSVSDQLFGDPGLKTDWAQKYIASRAAGYIGNSGFGYGDSESVALSERLMAQFAKRLHSNADSIGEQWVTALNDYFMTAGAYDVYDEKVMDEATFFGLPFWHFSTPGTGVSDTPLTTTADPITGTQSATVSISATPVQHVVGGHSFWDINGNTAFGLYRALQPIVSKPVPASLPARGVWIKQLATTDFPNITPKIGMPTIDLAAHEPIPNVQGTFFPASMFTLEKSIVLGKERPTVNITGQFRPNTPGAQVGTERVPNLATVEVFYGNGTDVIPPLISTVSVTTTGTGPYSSTIQTRVMDDSGNVAEVAALVNDGTWHYLQLTKSTQDSTIWEGTSANLLAPPEVFIEATDGLNTGFSANKGSNFTSAPPAAQTGPTIFVKDPTGPYAANQLVLASFSCVDPDGVATCDGTTSNGDPLDTSTFGLHTFTVTATDTLGNQSKLQRIYFVQYGFKGFFAPIGNPPVLNVVKAGSSVPIKFSLSGFQGLDIFAPNFPASEPIACDSTTFGGLAATMTPGGSSLQYFSSSDTYQYNWKTDGSWAGTCRALLVKTKDGAFHRADFQLTK